jgi:hypothetical protein
MPGGKNNAKLVAKDGPKVNWMKREGPAATMKYIIDNKLIDPKAPEKSLLVLKPLNEVQHGGGKKMMKNDACYKNYMTWINEYARTANKASARTDEPARPSVVSFARRRCGRKGPVVCPSLIEGLSSGTGLQPVPPGPIAR